MALRSFHLRREQGGEEDAAYAPRSRQPIQFLSARYSRVLKLWRCCGLLVAFRRVLVLHAEREEHREDRTIGRSGFRAESSGSGLALRA